MAHWSGYAVRVGKVGLFLSATSFSSASSFLAGEDASVHLTWISAMAFTSAAFYSVAKNFGVFDDITSIKSSIGDLRDRVKEYAAPLTSTRLIETPEATEMIIPVSAYSAKIIGFNQYTNAMTAIFMTLLTWLSGYDLLSEGASPWIALGAAVLFALVHVIAAHHLRQQMNTLLTEHQILIDQLEALVRIVYEDYDEAEHLLRRAEDLNHRLRIKNSRLQSRYSEVVETLENMPRSQRQAQQQLRTMFGELQDQAQEIRGLHAELNQARMHNQVLRDALTNASAQVDYLLWYRPIDWATGWGYVEEREMVETYYPGPQVGLG